MSEELKGHASFSLVYASGYDWTAGESETPSTSPDRREIAKARGSGYYDRGQNPLTSVFEAGMDSTEELNQRLIHLEECLAHQDRYVKELNDVLLSMRGEFDSMQREYDRRLGVLEMRIASLGEPHDPNEKPPHY